MSTRPIALLALLSLVGCVPEETGSAPDRITVGYAALRISQPLFVAEEGV